MRSGKVSGLWGRLGLLPRLVVMVVLAIMMGGSLRGYLLVRDESAYARAHLQSEIRETRNFLQLLLADPTLAGNLPLLRQIFENEVREHEHIDLIRWQHVGGELEMRKPDPSMLQAPGWFARSLKIAPVQLTRSVESAGKPVGNLSLRIDPTVDINRIWQHLVDHAKVVAMVILLVMVMAAAALRSNLRVLYRLAAAADRFKRGQHDMRVEADGPAETRSLALAFNSMADELADLVNSLHQNHRKFRAIFDQTFEYVGLLDRDGLLIEANQTSLTATGVAATDVIGKPFWDTLWWNHSETERDRLRDAVRRAAGGETVRFEVTHSTPGGAQHVVDFSLKPVVQEDGEIIWLIAEARDISASKQAELALFAEKERIQVTLSSIGDAVITTDVAGRVEYLNPVAEQLTGWTNAEAQGRAAGEVFHIVNENGGHVLDSPILQALESGTVVELESSALLISRHGREVAIEDSAAPIRDRSGAIVGCVLVFHDVSDKRRLLQQITWQAGHDALTKLPNRTLLADRLAQGIANAKRHGKLLVVCFVDLDGFKEVNDAYGHELGDRILIEAARRLSLVLRGGDTVARLGGDEFVLLLTDIGDMNEVEIAVDRMLSEISRAYEIEAREVRLSASVGVTVYPINDVDPDSLLRHADQAMYRAKQAGRNRYCLFDVSLDQQERFRYQEVERISDGLHSGEMQLYYQPKVNMRTGQVIGMEALLRWNHPARGVVQPLEFLPLIENDDLVLDIGYWVLEEALRQISVWLDAGLSLKVSVNLAARHFQEPDFVNQLRNLLALYPSVAPSMLELEILESAALEDVNAVRSIMKACQEFGVSFALDDFGAGYSSLNYLKRLPANTLKIDQSFVRNMLDDAGDLAIIEGVVTMANIFNLDVIAEGVETMEHGLLLMRLGCGSAQGYGIAHPMPAAVVPAWVARFTPHPCWQRWADKRWDLADFPLLVAQHDHVQWVRRVVQAAGGAALHLADSELRDHHHCRFGHWYYGLGRQRYGHMPGYHDLEGIHAKVHAVGTEIIRLRDAGDIPGAEALCPRLLELKTQVQDMLAELQNMVISVH